MTMNKDIELLSEALKEVMLPVCKEWNTVSLPMMQNLYRDRSFKSIFEGRQTQEKTKTVSPILDEIVAEFIKDKISNFTITEGKGFDYTLNDTQIEWKNSLSDSISWTGNGYNKTNWHVLCKFILNEDGVIEKYFACIVPYDMVESKWSPTGNSNFSELKLLKTDLDQVIEVVGSLKPSRKFSQPQYVSLT